MATTAEIVEKFYVEYFSRPADYAGLQYWTNILATNPNGADAISRDFAGSAEYQQTYANMDNTAIVQAIYHNLFGRAGEDAGVAYWVNLLNTHQMTVDNMVAQVAAGAQGSDAVVLSGRVAVATSFTQHLDTSAEQAAYSGTAANQIAKDFIGSIIDLQTAAAAIDPGVIDAKIAQIVGSQTATDATHFVA